MRRRLWSRLVGAACVGVAVGGVALAAYVARLPICPELEAPSASVRVLDRAGQLLAAVRSASGELNEPVLLSELPAHVVPALLAAEDARFFSHPGIDPLAIARALGQALWQRRIVSGASTLTQQLVRQTCERPRGVAGKLREMALALRLEAAWSKQQILEAYLNRVPFGPRVAGIGAASRRYFDKPAAALSLAEAAALVAVVRGPTLYDPERSLDAVKRRRDRILERMRRRELAPAEALDRALQTPVALRKAYLVPGAFHFVRALTSGKLRGALSEASAIESTLDAGLQQEVEAAVANAASHFAERRASAAAVLVIDNASAEILAYVGSPDYRAEDRLGQNDGVLALRQPGSALKPLVYALGIAELGLHASSVLPDIELRFRSPEGDYAPKNYDGRFHGPVLLRQALASSLNVPAVYLADRLGPERVLAFLRRLGFRSLTQAAEHYGPGIALGSAEVRLIELAAAYATLARGGEYRPLVAAHAAASAPNAALEPSGVAAERAIAPEVAAELTDILSDPAARAAGFGHDGVLEFAFPVAAKTGTSKGYRDNWAAGYTPRVSVVVWVGNFDGSPMLDSSGVSGAGPLFHAVMLAAARRFPSLPAALVEAPAVALCSLSGLRAGPHCAHSIRERYPSADSAMRSCDWHVELWADARDGGLSSPECTGAARRVFERYPAQYWAWAEASGRPLPPGSASQFCSGVRAALARPGDAADTVRAAAAPLIIFPTAGARFVLDPSRSSEQQAIVLRARGAGGPLRFVLDGKPLGSALPPYEVPWRLERGQHVLAVRSATGQSARVPFEVVSD